MDAPNIPHFWDSPAWLYAVLDSPDRALLVTDPAGIIRYGNVGVSRFLGYTPEELVGCTPVSLIADAAEPDAFFAKARLGEADDIEVKAVRNDGTPFPALLSVTAIREPGGAIGGFLCIIRDISREKAEEEARQETEERFRELFENASDLILSINPAGRFLYVNPAWKNTLGYSDAEIAAMTLQNILHAGHMTDCMERLGRILSGEDVGTIKTMFMTKDGREVVLEGKASCRFRDGKPIEVRGIFRDITQRHWYEHELERYRRNLEEANHRLEELATTDSLTGLKNRLVFEQRFEDEFRRAARYRVPLALLMLDVDHFKSFNDTFGHPAGDDVLRTLARALKVTARTTDLPARYGGEEFAILLPNTDPDGAAVSAERFRKVVEVSPWSLRPVTVSVGIASFTHDMASPDVLLAAADKALYRAKAGGRNRVEQ